MGKRNKQKRIDQIETFPNVLESATGEVPLQIENFVQGEVPVILEVGCGKGAYTIALAQMFREEKFIGIDVKGERIWVGAKYAQNSGLSNVRFVRGPVNDLLEYVKPGSVSEIWVTFPDPFPRSKQAKHRLTSPGFLQMYKKVLAPGGKVHLKTDDLDLFEYSLETIQEEKGTVVKAMANIYQETNLDLVLQIQTDFEKKHLAKGRKIYYLQASF